MPGTRLKAAPPSPGSLKKSPWSYGHLWGAVGKRFPASARSPPPPACFSWMCLSGWVAPSLPWEGFVDFSLLTRIDMTALPSKQGGNSAGREVQPGHTHFHTAHTQGLLRLTQSPHHSDATGQCDTHSTHLLTAGAHLGLLGTLPGQSCVRETNTHCGLTGPPQGTLGAFATSNGHPKPCL